MYVDVVLARPIDLPLTYCVPPELQEFIKVGHLVSVPFRKTTQEAYVVRKYTELQPPETYQIKKILKILTDETLFDENDLRFYQWISDYYQSSLGEVLFCAIPRVLKKGPRKRGSGSCNTNIITLENLLSSERDELILTEDQVNAVTQINECITRSIFHTFLLFGITGSGKTEVYLSSAKKSLSLGKSVIILVPEIALTPQLRSRFISQFGNDVAVLHSSLPEADRREFWWQLRRGRKKIAVGARSALFAPVQNLGLIVVDEEHETTYKQESHVRYNARDMAILRAQMSNAAVVLGSATPSIESYYAAEQKKYTLLKLKNRPKMRPMPQVSIVDLRLHQEDGLISEPLRNALIENYSTKQQSIIFLNRKGFAHHIICRDCGQTPGCPRCSVSLTYYKQSSQLRCHYCDYFTTAPSECTKCAGRDFKYIGYGTETLYEEISRFLPPESIRRLDADAASNHEKLETILSDFRSGVVSTLVGTQMLAKGHDFPNVTLIGVVLAESGLHIPDFRASERTFQLLSQVAGRAGRADKPGRVILQTFMPDHPIIQKAVHNDYEGFYQEEITVRKNLSYPPISRLVQIEFRDKDERKSREQAETLAKNLSSLNEKLEGIKIMGPAPAAITRVANEYRWQITLKAEKISVLNAYLRTSKKLGARFIDVDPMNTL